jgi:hypothetical protein
LPSLVALDIVLNHSKKKKSGSTATAQNWTPRPFGSERFVIFSIQVPDTRYQPTINLIWNQLWINLAFCVQSFGTWFCTATVLSSSARFDHNLKSSRLTAHFLKDNWVNLSGKHEFSYHIEHLGVTQNALNCTFQTGV